MTRTRLSIGDLHLSVTASGAGRPFLFIHGLCGDSGQTTELLPQVAGWRGICPDCRGHGDSEFGDIASLSIAQFTADMIALSRTLDGPSPVIGGISMGAAIALRAAVTHPDSFSGLVLARPAWVDRPAPDNLAPHRRIAGDMAAFGPDRAHAMFEDSAMARDIARQAPDNLNSLLGFFARQPAWQTQALLAAIAHDGPGVSRSAIAAIDMPCLVIGTGRDLAHPLAMAEELAGLVPKARLVEITSKSDNRDEYAEGFRAALRQFLEEME